jgi:Carboxypeptidase regulatory-like domain/Tetratricopeptide repeat
MFLPVSVVRLLFCFFVTTFASAQVSQWLPELDFIAPSSGAVAGKLLDADGRPAGGIPVELRKADTLAPVTATSTNPDGTFELYNIPQGHYEVEAHSGGIEVSQPVTIRAEQSTVHLRLPAAPTAAQIFGETISVARMLVPEKARKEYEKAKQAYLQGKYEDARGRIEQALLIHPQFADALTLRGMLELRNQDLAAAQLYLEESIRADPTSSAAYVMLGAVYNHEGRFDDALRASQRAVSLAPRAWQGYFEAAKASLAKAMYQNALQFAKDAERLGGGGFAGVHLVKAYAMLPLKLYKDAQHELQAFLLQDPKAEDAMQAQNLLAEAVADDSAVARPH